MRTAFKLYVALLTLIVITFANGQEISRPHPQYEGIVGFWTNVVVSAGETTRNVIVVGGSAKIDGSVKEDVIVIRGNVELNGGVDGNLVTLFGNAKIGDNAKVGRDVINVGSAVSVSPKAQIDGGKFEVLVGKILPEIGWIIDWIRYGVFRFRLFAPQVKLCWGLALATFILNLVLVLVFPKTINVCIESIKTRPVTSFAVGLLFSWILIPLLLFLLLISGVGILVMPFFMVAAVIACMFGKVGLYRFVGHQVGKIGGKDAIQSPVAALAIGSALLLLVYMLPLVGLIGWTAVTTLAFGAAIVAGISGLRGETSKGAPPPAQQLTPAAGQMTSGQSPQFASSEASLSSGASAYQTPATSPCQTTVAGQQTEQPLGQQSVEQQLPPQTTLPPTIQSSPTQQFIDYRLQPRVGFWRRFVATLIDFCVFIIPIAIFHAFAWVLWFAYHFLMWKMSGATVGDMIMGIKIVREDGRELDWKTSIIRALGGILSATGLFLGFFWAGWSRDKKAWHDYIAGTIVVKNPAKMF